MSRTWSEGSRSTQRVRLGREVLEVLRQSLAAAYEMARKSGAKMPKRKK